MQIEFNPEEIDKTYCSYTHSVTYDEGEKIMYAGCCLLREVFQSPDARHNSAWREYIAKQPKVKIEIKGVFTHRYEAYNDMARISRENEPYCNVFGKLDKSSGSIRCVNDGNEFLNQSKAAEFYGITRGAMSNHIKRRKGYATIRGLTFERV